MRLGRERWIVILGGLSVLFFSFYRLMPFDKAADREEMLLASERMALAEKELWTCREESFPAEVRTIDFNRTGLIGIETSPITTTLGNLEAKRTVTNPNFAGLIVRLLKDAGAKKGDVIAIGASSSFPGLILASLSAARVMDLKALLICSLGASQWGANDPRFDWLDMSQCLARRRDMNAVTLALTLGGEKDVGLDFSEEGRLFLQKKIRDSSLPFFEESDLKRNVEHRIKLYGDQAGGHKIKAFINIGGSWANMGEDASILRLKPGLTEVRFIPPQERRGVIQEMANRGIPVIHLLNVHGLAERYGLPWDPSPLPHPGEGGIYDSDLSVRRGFFILIGIYFVFVGYFVFRYVGNNNKNRIKAATHSRASWDPPSKDR